MRKQSSQWAEKVFTKTIYSNAGKAEYKSHVYFYNKSVVQHKFLNDCQTVLLWSAMRSERKCHEKRTKL